MKIIGLHGKARSGKDEVCKILCKTYGFEKISYAESLKNLSIKYFGLNKKQISGPKTKEIRTILQGIGLSVREQITNVYKYFNNRTNEVINEGHNYPVWVELLAIHFFGIKESDITRKTKYIINVCSGIQNMWINEIAYFYEMTKLNDNDIWVNILLSKLNHKDKNIVYVLSDVRFLNEYNTIKNLNGKVVLINRIDKPKIEAGENHLSEVELDNIKDWDFEIVNEHKTDWEQKLVLSSANMVRKFKSENFFNQEHVNKFKINLEPYG